MGAVPDPGVTLPPPRFVGASSHDQCSLCGPEQFFISGGGCAPCRPPCNASLGEFELEPCTDLGNRRCGVCGSGEECGVGEFFVGCSAQNPRGCSPCTNAPEGGVARYTAPPPGGLGPGAGSSVCTWVCNDGLFLDPDSGGCSQCTVFNGTTCPPGRVESACEVSSFHTTRCPICLR